MRATERSTMALDIIDHSSIEVLLFTEYFYLKHIKEVLSYETVGSRFRIYVNGCKNNAANCYNDKIFACSTTSGP